jgi:hypothetical protein
MPLNIACTLLRGHFGDTKSDTDRMRKIPMEESSDLGGYRPKCLWVRRPYGASVLPRIVLVSYYVSV